MCLNQNNDVSANVANFVPLDNNSLLDRLENLITNDSYSFKIGNLIVQGGYAILRTGYIYFPRQFPNSCISVIPVPSGSGITEVNEDSLVIDDSLSNEDRKSKFKVLAKNKTTQIRINYIAIGY
nr:MAG TPA: putative tail fiber protein [Caudoviricetes sp.]